MAATDNNIFNWLHLVSKVPPALLQRLQPDPTQTLMPRQSYEMGGVSGEPATSWLKGLAAAAPVPMAEPEPGYQMGGVQNASALMPFLQQAASRPAPPKRHVSPVSSKIATRGAPQSPEPPTPAGFSFIPAAAAAESAPAFYSEPSVPLDPGAGASSAPQTGIMAQLQNYLDRMNQPQDRNVEMQDNLLALAIGGLNTAAAASRPGATTLGSFAEGNAGGLNTMLAMRGQRRREESDRAREQLGVMGTMANLENSAATRADTKAYREAALGADAATREQRRREAEANIGLNREKLAEDRRQADASIGLRRDALTAEAPVRQSQVAENVARAKYYEGGGASGGPGGSQDPADVRAANWLIQNKVASDPSMAWDMVRRAKQNPDEALTKIYTGIANDPLNMRKSPDELAGMARQAYRSLFEAPATASSAAPQQGMPQGARQAKDGQWYVPDQNSKSGWSRVVTTP